MREIGVHIWLGNVAFVIYPLGTGLKVLVQHVRVRLSNLKYIPLYLRYSAPESIFKDIQTRISLGPHPGRSWAITGKHQNKQRTHHNAKRNKGCGHYRCGWLEISGDTREKSENGTCHTAGDSIRDASNHNENSFTSVQRK